MQIISSKDNDIIKNIKKLKEKKYRDLEGKFIVEGIKLVEEATRENAKISKVVICEEQLNNGDLPKELLYKIAKYDCIYVTEKVFQTLTEVKTPQGILAVINKNNQNNEVDYSQDIIIALDDIQDPGNLGTIIRTIDSADLNQVIVSKGSSDCYSSKVVRSTMGAIFRVNIIETENLCEMLKQMQKHKFKIVSTDLCANKDIYSIDYKNKVIVIGNEANGVSNEVKQMSNEKIKIPMLGKTESLNASVATGVVLYEYIRRKVNI